MTTHSQLVDQIVREVGRPDLVDTVSTYLNQTIREVHLTTDNDGRNKSKAVLFKENYQEDQLVADVANGFYWDAPNPQRFQQVTLVQYVDIIDSSQLVTASNTGVYPPFVEPSRALMGKEQYYYRGGSRYVFVGYGAIGSRINISWYEFCKRLVYFPVGGRPAEWDEETESWDYAPEFDTDDAMRLAAQNLVTNWLLMRWQDVILEGLRAKIYKRLSDDTRAALSYSLWEQLKPGLYSSEMSMVGGYS
jgi:hypothetical protein